MYGFICGYDTTAAPTATLPTVLSQYNLPGHFQPNTKVQDMNITIYHEIGNPKVFKSNLPQQRIVEQNFGNGHVVLHQLIDADHPIN